MAVVTDGKRCCAGLPHWSSQNPIGGQVKVPCESINFRAQAEALRAQLMKGLDISTFNPHGSSYEWSGWSLEAI
ncbi:unnamed protein product [Calypogeia fissa]